MIAINDLDHIGLRVTDFVRSVAFYREFGFEVIREDFHERVIVLRHSNGIVLNLLDSVNHDAEAHNILMDEAIKHAGYTHVAFQVANINQAIQFLKTIGVEITEGPVTFGDSKTSIFIRDPDRNVIEFTQFPVMQKMRQEVTT